MSAFVIVALIMLILLVAGTLRYITTTERGDCRPKGYDPHYTRALELQTLGYALTTCNDIACKVCNPAEPAPQRKSRAIGGYEVSVPDGVPDSAYATISANPSGDFLRVLWVWTDKNSGKQNYLTSLVPNFGNELYAVYADGRQKPIKIYEA